MEANVAILTIFKALAVAEDVNVITSTNDIKDISTITCKTPIGFIVELLINVDEIIDVNQSGFNTYDNKIQG